MNSVEDEEMVLFKKFAPIWWDENGPFRALHRFNSIRVPHIQNCLIETKAAANSLQPLQDLLILDAGCGAGILAEALAKLKCQVVGLDPCEDMVQLARNHAALNPDLASLRYVMGSVEEHSETNFEKYDCVVSSYVLEHVTKYEQYLAGCIKCLKPGGSIVVSTFNKTFGGWFEAIFLYENLCGVIPKGMHQWRKFISLGEVERILEKYHCKLMGSCGMTYSIRKKSWRITNDKSVTYGVHAIKMTS